MSAGEGNEPNPKKVGYGNPPVESQFQKGKSGNPKGRPRGSKNKLCDHQGKFNEYIRSEGYREISVQDDGTQISIPMAKAILRALAIKAAKGNVQASKQFLQMHKAADDEFNKSKHDTLSKFVADKRITSEYLRSPHLFEGQFKMPLPHPDHIQIDPETLEISVTGPVDHEQLKNWKFMMLEIAHMEVSIEKSQKNLDTNCDHYEALMENIQFDQKMLILLREHVSEYDPLWLYEKDALRKKWIDYMYYYGDDPHDCPSYQYVRAKLNAKVQAKRSKKPTIKQHYRPHVNNRDAFTKFMREKLMEMMGEDWHLRLNSPEHFERDIELDKMRFEYDTGIFDFKKYVLNDGEDVLFQDEEFLKVYMSWEPDEEPLIGLARYYNAL